MDGLMPLIDLAGADGAISAAQLDQLILEAKTRGVSEADARAYLTKYAASRGWQLGAQVGSRRARRRAGPAPTPSQPPQPASPQPAQPPLPPSPQPAPDRAFRWVAAGVVALAAIAVIMVVTRKEQPQVTPATPQPIAPSTPTPTPVPTPDPQKQWADLVDREQRTYNAARGNLSTLQAYVEK